MFGLKEHTPFECIGQIEEMHLAALVCLAQGRTGRALELFEPLRASVNPEAIVNHFVPATVDMALTANWPTELATALTQVVQQLLDSGRARLAEQLHISLT